MCLELNGYKVINIASKCNDVRPNIINNLVFPLIVGLILLVLTYIVINKRVNDIQLKKHSSELQRLCISLERFVIKVKQQIHFSRDYVTFIDSLIYSDVGTETLKECKTDLGIESKSYYEECEKLYYEILNNNNFSEVTCKEFSNVLEDLSLLHLNQSQLYDFSIIYYNEIQELENPSYTEFCEKRAEELFDNPFKHYLTYSRTHLEIMNDHRNNVIHDVAILEAMLLELKEKIPGEKDKLS